MGGLKTIEREASYRIRALGTRAELIVTEPDVLVAAAEVLRSELDQIDRAASRFRADSEVSQLQRSDGAWTVVSPYLLEVVLVALRIAEATDGAVDPTVGEALCRLGYDRDFSLIAAGVDGPLPVSAPVPGWQRIEVDRSAGSVRVPPGTHLDLGATAKAWVADRVAAQVHDRYRCGVLVSLGGDVAVAGPPPAGGFRIGLGDIAGGVPTGGTVAVAAGGLATSGLSVRTWRLGGHLVHHILDPATGQPVESIWRTVSVAGATCVDANAASTAAMVKGRHAISWLADRHLPSRLVGSDGIVTCIAGWPDDAVHFTGAPTG